MYIPFSGLYAKTPLKNYLPFAAIGYVTNYRKTCGWKFQEWKQHVSVRIIQIFRPLPYKGEILWQFKNPWAEFVFSCCRCSKWFLFRYSSFLHSSETDLSKFQ